MAYACEKENLLAMSMLLEVGADPNFRMNRVNDCALTYASVFNNAPAITLLLKAGANPNSQNIVSI